MAANKVVFGNKVLIDLTGDTVTEEALFLHYSYTAIPIFERQIQVILFFLFQF